MGLLVILFIFLSPQIILHTVLMHEWIDLKFLMLIASWLQNCLALISYVSMYNFLAGLDMNANNIFAYYRCSNIRVYDIAHAMS
jgi:hypothetical protein